MTNMDPNYDRLTSNSMTFAAKIETGFRNQDNGDNKPKDNPTRNTYINESGDFKQCTNNYGSHGPEDTIGSSTLIDQVNPVKRCAVQDGKETITL